MRVLLVEDDDSEAALVAAELEGVHGTEALELVRERSLAEALARLDLAPFEVVLLDLSLPDCHGLDGLDRIRQHAPHVTVVMLTDHHDDEVACQAVRRGAQDYLIKGEHSPALLWRSLRHAIERARATRAAAAHQTDGETARQRKLIEAESAMLAGILDRREGTKVRSPFQPGVQLGARYLLGELIGEGASSHVYGARDLTTSADVCVKHLRTGASEVAANEIARATRLTATLGHPHIVRILDFGTVWGEPYLVMELARGGPLSRLTEAGPTAPARAREIMLEILDGLAYIHSHDTLHLDLKPANVVLDEDGHAKITDFGIALHAAGLEWNETQSSLGAPRIFGTPAYVSPEVVSGLPPTIRSEIYSAGALLYELLAGRPYVDLRGMDLFAVRAAIREHIPLPNAPGGEVLAVALRALAKDPTRRYDSANEMREALARATPPATIARVLRVDAEGEPAPATPGPPTPMSG